MGCGCKGSAAAATTRQAARAARTADAKAKPKREARPGLPGEAGYTWNGPPRR